MTQDIMSTEQKRFEEWWDAEDDIPNNGPWTHDTPIQFAWAGWQAALPQPEQKPIGYLFQHEETGLTTVVDVQQVEWGFEKNNPRHQKIGPVYTTPPQRKPLTDEQIDELSHTMVKGSKSANWLCRAIEAAHGIKEKNNG